MDAGTTLLTAEDFENTRALAEEQVEVSGEILNIVADLRTYLQDACEPPVYVSDRRLVKSVALLQVAAFTSGRKYVTPKDCMLLQHVLWNRPEEADKIYEWLLKALTQDEGMQQLQYLLSGMFGRACKSLNNPEQASAVARDVQQLRLTLEEKLVDIIFKQMGREREMTLWSSADERDALDTALSPKLDKSRDETERLLYEVITLEVRLRARRAYFLACLLYSAHIATRLDVPCVLVSGHLAIWSSGHLAIWPSGCRVRPDPDESSSTITSLQKALVNGAGPVELASLLPNQWRDFLR